MHSIYTAKVSICIIKMHLIPDFLTNISLWLWHMHIFCSKVSFFSCDWYFMLSLFYKLKKFKIRKNKLCVNGPLIIINIKFYDSLSFEITQTPNVLTILAGGPGGSIINVFMGTISPVRIIFHLGPSMRLPMLATRDTERSEYSWLTSSLVSTPMESVWHSGQFLSTE